MKLKDIHREADSALDSFIHTIETFPGYANKIVCDFYDKAIKGPLRLPVLSELAPWVLCDLIGLSTYDPAKTMFESWYLLNLYSLSYRQLESLENISDQSPEMIAAKLLLQKGITHFYALNPDARTGIPQLIDSWFNQISNPPPLDKLVEVDQSPFDMLIAKELSRQTISMYMCSQILCIRAFYQTPNPDIIKKIAALTISLRSLDGLMHWYEDMISNCKNNLFNSMILSNMDQKDNIKLLTKEELILLLASSGTLMRVLNITTDFIRVALDGFKKSPTPTRAYLESLYEYSKNNIVDFNIIHPELESIKVGPTKNTLARFLSTTPGSDIVKRIEGFISELSELAWEL